MFTNHTEKYIDRVPYFSYFAKNTFQSHTTNMSTFVFLRHPVTILVTDLTNPDNFDYKGSKQIRVVRPWHGHLMVLTEQFTFNDSIFMMGNLLI